VSPCSNVKEDERFIAERGRHLSVGHGNERGSAAGLSLTFENGELMLAFLKQTDLILI